MKWARVMLPVVFEELELACIFFYFFAIFSFLGRLKEKISKFSLNFYVFVLWFEYTNLYVHRKWHECTNLYVHGKWHSVIKHYHYQIIR